MARFAYFFHLAFILSRVREAARRTDSMPKERTKGSPWACTAGDINMGFVHIRDAVPSPAPILWTPSCVPSALRGRGESDAVPIWLLSPEVG